MGICGSNTGKHVPAYKYQNNTGNEKPIHTNNVAKIPQTTTFTSLNPSNQFSAQNKDFPAYFIGLGKSNVKTILAFDEERMAFVEKIIWFSNRNVGAGL